LKDPEDGLEKKISPKVSLVIAKVAISIVLDLEAMILVQ